MSHNPLKTLEAFGQSIWMDFLRRGALTSGQLHRWIYEDGVSGVTSNPSIFEKAIVDSHDYDEVIERLSAAGKDPEEIYTELTIEDIRQTADILRPVYEQTQGADGFVSLEVSPHLAHNTPGSIAEARRLWNRVDRPNLMIKIPSTPAGIPAIRQLIGERINVNITLLFTLPRYQDVIEAYFSGLESREAQGLPVNEVTSVASFFLSRIDVLVDPMLQAIVNGSDAEKSRLARTLVGQTAIASAKIAYQIFLLSVQSQRFQRLAALGARPQRLLWASTSTKNPAYSDVRYVESLIGPDTINTLPVETLDAYRDHGNPAARLRDGVEQAYEQLDLLSELGIDLDRVGDRLEAQGVDKFNRSYDQLLERLADKVKAVVVG